MIRGLYSAASGLKGLSIQQDALARNLSQVNKPGYRRQIVSFETLGPRGEFMGTKPTNQTDFAVGDPTHTGRDLDVALADDGFFVVEEADGMELLTRNGVFQVNSAGQLTTTEGRIVQGVVQPGVNGPINIPPDTTQVNFLDDGSVVANGITVGQLRVVKMADNNELTRVGSALFRKADDANFVEGTNSVRQGYRERSNGAPVEEMVKMLHGMRHFEAAQRALKTINEALQQSTNPNR